MLFKCVSEVVYSFNDKRSSKLRTHIPFALIEQVSYNYVSECIVVKSTTFLYSLRRTSSSPLLVVMERIMHGQFVNERPCGLACGTNGMCATICINNCLQLF